MNKNQVLQIKKFPTPRQWNGGTVHTIGACTTTNSTSKLYFLLLTFYDLFHIIETKISADVIPQGTCMKNNLLYYIE